MKFEDIQVGMKVIPVSKRAGEPSLLGCVSLKRAKNINQVFLYVHKKFIDKFTNKETLLCSHEPILTKNWGDYFLPSDLIPYEIEPISIYNAIHNPKIKISN